MANDGIPGCKKHLEEIRNGGGGALFIDEAYQLVSGDQMEALFQNLNPGLSRRFLMTSAFHFEDYTDDDLQTILNLKLKQIGFDATTEAKTVVRECLRLARNKPHFGNAGEVDILLDAAKMEHQKLLSSRQTKSIDTLEALDFDSNFNRVE